VITGVSHRGLVVISTLQKPVAMFAAMMSIFLSQLRSAI
jgi:hypothetical protein